MSEHVGRFVGFDVEEEAGPLPYLVERLMAAVYRRENLPGFLSRGEMIQIAERRSSTTGRRVCLVLGAAKCIYFEPDGRRACSEDAPSGGVGIEK